MLPRPDIQSKHNKVEKPLKLGQNCNYHREAALLPE